MVKIYENISVLMII